MTTGKKVSIAIVVLAVGGVVAANLAQSSKKGTPVEVHTAGYEDVVARVSCRGTIQAKRKVDISANVIGQIVNLAVREGERVERNQFLLQIDQAQLQAQTAGSQAALQVLLAERDASRANAEQARLDHERAAKNFAERIIAEADFQRAGAALESAKASLAAVERRIEQARAALDASRDSLSKTTIRAPIAGTVTALPVEEGEIAVMGTMNNAGTKLMTISDLSEIEAEMEVDETDVPRVAIGQTVALRIDAYPGRTLEGTVSEIGSSPIVRAGSSQAIEFLVKVAVKDPPESVRPGFSVTGDVQVGERKQVVAIPIQALVIQDLAEKVAARERGDDETKSERVDDAGPADAGEDVEGVFTIEADKAKFVPLKTGLQGELQIEVLEGLEAGVQVIKGPFRALRQLKEGDRVRIEEKKEKQAGSSRAGR